MEVVDIIKPQEGFQTNVLSSSADIVICGGSAGGGKSAVLLMDAARWHFVKGYGAVIFRRSYPEIMMQDGLWDQSQKFYLPLGGQSNETALRWKFPDGSRITFSHLQHEKDLLNHQGSQYAFIGFDELTHFTRKEFIYLLSRSRSLCGVDPVIRATCNPDPESWVADFISWFINPDNGFPILERCGQLRYFTSDNGTFVWGSTREEVVEKCPHIFDRQDIKDTGIKVTELVKSMTFIPGSIFENKVLLSADPRYLGNLMAMDAEEKSRLLDGNWKIGLNDTDLFPLGAINDMFSFTPLNNFVANNKKYITVDHARFGKDLCTLFTWEDWNVKRIDILPVSNSHDVVNVVQRIRQIHRPIPVSQILVDQDGIGVHDLLRCKVFQGNAAAEPENKDLTSDYKNRRAQNYYAASKALASSKISVNLEEIYIWLKHPTNETLLPPQKIVEIKVKGETHKIAHLIREDLRTVKRYHVDKETKKMVTPKDQQKNSLGGRSPDFGDNFMMRADFELIPQPQYVRQR